MKKGVFLNLLLCIMLLSGCSKEDEENNSSPLVLAAEKELYAPFEIVTITASEAIFGAQTNSIEGTINGSVVSIQPGDTTASFLLPSLENGTYEVEFVAGEKKYKVAIVVQQLSNIATADSYYNQMKANVYQNIEKLNMHLQQMIAAGATTQEYTPIRDDIAKYSNILKEYEDKYAALTPEEKQDFAAFMAANQNLITEIETANTAFSSALGKMRTQQVQNYEEITEVTATAFVSSVIITVAHIPAIITLATMSVSPNPFFFAAIAAAGIVLVSYLVHVAEVKAMAGILLNRALKPYEGLTVSQAIFQMGQEIEVTVAGKYRSLISTDGLDSENGNVITKIVTTFDSLKEKINNLSNKLPEKFRPSNPIQAIKSTFNSAVRPIYNKYISISNISNPNVTLQQIDQEDGSIKLKATTSLTTDQQFTYDIEYTNENFTKGLKKTISAEVKAAVDSTEVYRNAAIGKYAVTNYQGNGPNAILFCELLANNVAKYTTYSDTSWPDGTVFTENWTVNKVDDKYYITTSFTNPGHIISEAQPLDYPITSFVYRHTYIKQ